MSSSQLARESGISPSHPSYPLPDSLDDPPPNSIEQCDALLVRLVLKVVQVNKRVQQLRAQQSRNTPQPEWHNPVDHPRESDADKGQPASTLAAAADLRQDYVVQGSPPVGKSTGWSNPNPWRVNPSRVRVRIAIGQPVIPAVTRGRPATPDDAETTTVSNSLSCVAPSDIESPHSLPIVDMDTRSAGTGKGATKRRMSRQEVSSRKKLKRSAPWDSAEEDPDYQASPTHCSSSPTSNSASDDTAAAQTAFGETDFTFLHYSCLLLFFL
ncbi:hypothetical protein FISHEDRAFT_73730 [Fistulina hepatica ATCC 64428]|uniref:Uncharacterized protein n=1 Tax=Fistulina hepatica ATCC 64428 TaxID=1128425 RepID=A0A0D7AE66_9AGAR|nr:hypothetical protein FISHEDRAFT_73730 [Fistulina hepatica ATCC 64428]